MDKKTATEHALKALETVTAEPDGWELLPGTTVLFLEKDGTYSVMDNGEEVRGLDRESAIRIICENLADW